MISAYSFCVVSRVVSRRRRAIPSTPLSGVRSSWLTLARNSDLTREVSWAACRARTSTSMSWATATAPATSPAGPRQGCTAQVT